MTDLTREQIETMRLGMKLNGWFHKDDREALCRMALAYLDATAWRPIETAPKDGTRVLLLIQGVPVVGYWNNGLTTDGKAVMAPIWERDNDTELMPPTHWLPLPNPPAAIRAQKEGE